MMIHPISPLPGEPSVAGPLRAIGPILDEFPAATYTCDAAGYLTSFNTPAVDLWGRTPRLRPAGERYCGSHRLFHPDGSPMPREASWMALALAQERGFNGRELVIERPGGSRVTALSHAHPVHDDAGRLVGGVNVLVDISSGRQAEEERRRVQAQLVQSQKLESLGRLTAGVAHDFNNQLTVILGLSSLVTEELPPDSPLRPLLNQVEVAARRASGLATQLSAFAGKDTLTGDSVSLDRLVGEIRQLIEAVASRRTRLELSLAPAVVWGEAPRIRQVVMSLIVNAADSFEGGTGRIWVTTAQVDAGVEPFVSRFEQEPVERGVFGMVEVRDSGSGMSRDVMGQIFDPFFSTRSIGRGLGLTAVHGIVKAHHGALDVQSVPGEGTTVRVYFPHSRP